MRLPDGRLHFSDLKYIDESPLAYQHHLNNPSEDTRSYLLGRMAHRSWLQGEDVPAWIGRRDLRNKAYQEYLEQHGEKPLNPKELEIVQGMVDALNRSADAMAIKSRCTEFEKPLIWTRNGIKCAGTLDMCGPGILAELKSCESRKMHPEAFQRQGARWHYPEQCAWYSVGNGVEPIANLQTGGLIMPWPETYVIAVENSKPFDVVVHRLGEMLLDKANDTVERWLETYSECLASGIWPGRAPGVVAWDSPDADIELAD
jgi:hypothetical protein